MEKIFKQLGDSILAINYKSSELEFFIEEYSLFRGGFSNVYCNCINLLHTIESDSEVLSDLSDDEIVTLQNFIENIIEFSKYDNEIARLDEFDVFYNDPARSLNGITNLLIHYFYYS